MLLAKLSRMAELRRTENELPVPQETVSPIAGAVSRELPEAEESPPPLPAVPSDEHAGRTRSAASIAAVVSRVGTGAAWPEDIEDG
jgi:hypothetical protein